MILSIKDIAYIHPNRDTLFQGVSLSLAKSEKISLIGANGTGKSTLLRIVAGQLAPSSGEVWHASEPYYLPQHFGQYDHLTIAGALGIEAKIAALAAISAGSVDERHYTALGDDWTIEEQAAEALKAWGLEGFGLDRAMSELSGGEKTRVFLAGAALHRPEIILMDEPSNHLDAKVRERLYSFISESDAAMIVVSHDRRLLNLLDRTYELTAQGITSYGGNYEFYKQQREAERKALADELHEGQKSLRKAQQVAREAAERKNRSDSRGGGKTKKEGVPRIMLKTIKDRASATDKRLKEVHQAKIEGLEASVRESREKIGPERSLQIKLHGSGLHSGKLLVEAEEMNFGYSPERMLWPEPLSLRITSGERIAVQGANGSGKSTLVRIVTGDLEPACGTIRRSDFSSLYIDQEYFLIDNRLTVAEFVERHNRRNLPGSFVRTELHRFLFPAGSWDKPCGVLSGGEKMRLVLCAMMVGDSAPDMFILDEPTNNLDIRSLDILTDALRGYEGTLLAISHDRYFLDEIGVTSYIELG